MREEAAMRKKCALRIRTRGLYSRGFLFLKLRHCEEQRDEAIQGLNKQHWIATLLAVARNDGKNTKNLNYEH